MDFFAILFLLEWAGCFGVVGGDGEGDGWLQCIVAAGAVFSRRAVIATLSPLMAWTGLRLVVAPVRFLLLEFGDVLQDLLLGIEPVLRQL